MQGLAGAAGIVISRAIVRDLHAGRAAARLFASLMVVSNTAPIVAPVIGGQLLGFTTWRGIFIVLAGIGVALLVAATAGLRESLPAERRRPAGLRPLTAALREVATTTTLALAEHGAVAGSASALLGVLQYLLGAVTAPLVGAAGTDTAVPMAALMLTLSLAAAIALRLRRRTNGTSA